MSPRALRNLSGPARETPQKKRTGFYPSPFDQYPPPGTEPNLLQRIISRRSRRRRIEANDAALVGEEIPAAGLTRSRRLTVQIETSIRSTASWRVRKVVAALGSCLRCRIR